MAGDHPCVHPLFIHLISSFICWSMYTLADLRPMVQIAIWKSLSHPNVLELLGASSASSDPPWLFIGAQRAQDGVRGLGPESRWTSAGGRSGDCCFWV